MALTIRHDSIRASESIIDVKHETTIKTKYIHFELKYPILLPDGQGQVAGCHTESDVTRSQLVISSPNIVNL